MSLTLTLKESGIGSSKVIRVTYVVKLPITIALKVTLPLCCKNLRGRILGVVSVIVTTPSSLKELEKKKLQELK